MTTQVAAPEDLLGRFGEWANYKIASLFPEKFPDAQGVDDTGRVDEADVDQGKVFSEDLKRCAHTFSSDLRYEVASLARHVATVVGAPFAAMGEVFYLCRGSITASECLLNLSIVPIRLFKSVIGGVCCVPSAANTLINTGAIGVGFLTWHGGERLVRKIRGFPHTVLSNTPKYRDVVYNSIGLTVLSAAMVFIPIAPIQMIALPILMGSIYGTINNQFTVRERPEYYTMGHDYDGTRLRGHAIKTNNVLIKPIITGCYATTMVTKIMGVVLSAAGTLPFAAAALPVSYAGAMIAGTCAISLVTAHIFSMMTKQTLQNDLKAYATLTGIEWTDTICNQTWSELADMRHEREEQKRHALMANPQELARFNDRLEQLKEAIHDEILSHDLPIKYITGWAANNKRNLTGYLAAGAGTLACTVATVFLRVCVL